ncbi:hypothetical protein MMAG44476_39482 [Mycolicibacterium mageritense DSM 44476 = CIP 104973]|uniref:Uncharacterized protein n=1 Tax=Mycolicibacterium mageritense TaxID=53462 RepID=A0AAI8XQ17_MYCME|nr:hypothetical protein [Mycolicibacterium mageritense]MCC9180374.1 hypothetical protein [Mycolicibacterium mageritense]TXI52959.1 MAG: hypothetical protein E6Q55_36160 [Mycolicibacterium mageritense]CDO19843.1 hypothetical protein BN978_00294 [Mycolicibacterium mageritense DSM 44476 = CIP 104973]BBX35651.1 hypothetical protein MMAGJ_49330 [Mycolicibacterium mageritense]BDY30550.1 hypothetical protein hbim_04494 [Mycolicibacterium mageritense]
MSTLVDEVLDAYGGATRWKNVETIRAHKRFGGAIWDLKQVPGIVDDGEITVWIQQQHTSLSPFTGSDRKSDYTPQRVAIESLDGATVDALDDPRSSFAGHSLQTPWSTLQLAYFTGYAMWTYLAEPFNLTLPGVTVVEGSNWVEDGQIWRRLRVDYPQDIATHSPQQVLYIDDQGLIRRRDYQVDIAGGSPAAHYVSEFEDIGGIIVPAKRMIFVRDDAGHPIPDQLVVSIELTDIRFD